jgi:hypothetical protein
VGWARVTVHKVELVGCCCIYTICLGGHQRGVSCEKSLLILLTVPL